MAEKLETLLVESMAVRTAVTMAVRSVEWKVVMLVDEMVAMSVV